MELYLGALADSISSQLEKQGYCLSKDKEEKFEKLRFAISLLHIHGYIAESQASKARQKLMKEICKNTEKLVGK